MPLRVPWAGLLVTLKVSDDPWSDEPVSVMPTGCGAMSVTVWAVAVGGISTLATVRLMKASVEVRPPSVAVNPITSGPENSWVGT